VVNGKEPDDRERMREEQEMGEAGERAHPRREHWVQTVGWPNGRPLTMIGGALAMMGRFGWTIVGPILLGAFVGRWLDRTFNSGVFWSAALVFAGAALGFWAVWKRMNSE
jgi:ATP synthase protein I